MSIDENSPQRNPYGDNANVYRSRGYMGALPLPPGRKEMPPKGFTGHGRPYPDDEQVEEWIAEQPQGNICLRLGEVDDDDLGDRRMPVVYAGSNVDGWALFGLDVDDYTDGDVTKRGAQQLADLEAELGPLPATAMSSARWADRPLSGIRVFLVPRGYRYKSKAADHIETVHAGHRYAVVWPSRHPSGSTYEWRGTDGDYPVLADIAVLPEKWFAYLMVCAGTGADALAGLSPDELDTWAQATFRDCTGEPCVLMQRKLEERTDDLDEANQHDPLTKDIWHLTMLAVEGHAGWFTTVNEYINRWGTVSRGKRDVEEMNGEVWRSINGALDKAKARHDGRNNYLPDDTCAVDATKYDCEAWASNVKTAAVEVEFDDTDPDADGHGWLSDANVSKLLVDRVLKGKYVWATGFGWMKWDGHRWKRTTDADVIERSRRFARRLVAEAAQREEADKIKAFTRRLTAGAIAAAANLAKGQLLVDAADFDCHPDLLNVGNGVVDLRTGELRRPDPALLLTKWTPTYYDGDATHPDWAAAISALPAEVGVWAQVRLGQAISGHPTPDDVLVVFQGGGENGKSTVTVAVAKALGDHAVTVPERLLTANPSDHPTELMTLRGARLAMMEETPEARYLNVKRLKDVLGTPTMSARLIRQDNVSWTATHSLFLSTNYRPRVSETDHGTWRRLMLARFPFTYRKAHEELTSTLDRRGDAGLRERMKLSPSKQHEAVLRWLIDGAIRWYAAGQEMPPPPECVERDTRRWRQSSDPIMGLFDDLLVADPGYFIPTSELFAMFSRRLDESGQKAWSERTFAERFEGHDEIKSRRIYRDRVRPGSSELTASVSPLTRFDLPERLRAWVGVRFSTEADDGGDQVK